MRLLIATFDILTCFPANVKLYPLR